MAARRIVLVAIAVAAALAIAVAVTGIRALSFPSYWREAARQPAPENALRILAFGDSAMVAVGALDPMNGIAGRISRHLEERTGEPVHITNRSVGGATVADLLRQIDATEVAAADVVLVVTSNDAQQGVPLDRFRDDLVQLLELLPADRTIVGGLPPLPGAQPYEDVLADVTSKHGVARADVAAVFEGPGRRLDVFSLLPPHLNDLGYQFWADAFRHPLDQLFPQAVFQQIGVPRS